MIYLKTLKSGISTVLLTGIILCIILNPKAREGGLNGLNLCMNIIIPSLLPILIITNILIKTKCTIFLEKLFGWFTVKILRLPICTTSTIIFSLIGGYPTGAILIDHLYSTNQIDTNTAKRLMSFCFCGGVAFIITSVGTITLKNTKLGIILYLICIITSILIAIISSFFYPKIVDKKQEYNDYLSLTDALIEGTQSASKSILNMSAYIILFSSLINTIPLPSKITPIIEITSGICKNSFLSLNYICAFLAFGGLCIHFQLLPIIKKIGIKYYEFLFYRILSSVICFVLTSIYLNFFPQSINVFCNITTSTPQLYQVNTALSIIMIISSVALILDLDTQKNYHLPN